MVKTKKKSVILKKPNFNGLNNFNTLNKLRYAVLLIFILATISIIIIFIGDFIIAAILIILSYPTLAGEPKSYYYTPSISRDADLAIKGQLLTSIYTGSITYSIPIEIPAGTNGQKPHLGILYNSHSTKQSGLFGNAWSVTQNYIERN